MKRAGLAGEERQEGWLWCLWAQEPDWGAEAVLAVKNLVGQVFGGAYKLLYYAEEHRYNMIYVESRLAKLQTRI